MKPPSVSTRTARRRRHELLREFFACAVVIAAIKSGHPSRPGETPTAAGPSPAGRL